MANPNTPPDQPAPSISAAELRRRLLASTPPPIVATASAPDIVAELPDEPETLPAPTPAPNPSGSVIGNWGSSTDLLAKLRMPGKSGSVPVPASRPVPAVPVVPEPYQTRTPVNRRPPNGSRLYGESNGSIAGALNTLTDLSNSSRHDDSPMAEIQRLKNENKELRTLLDEMKHLLQEASNTEQQLAAKEKEFAATLAEKDAHIGELNAHLGSIEDQIAKGELAPPPPAPKTRSELEEWGDDLERESAKLAQEKKRLDEDRRQLREDEEALERQMREMEVSMARERALLARQETELKRLHAEIQHDIEIMQRGDAGLREQMAKFQRRAQEVMAKPGGGGAPGRR